MLLELAISNFAIIDRLGLKLNPGFNVLTGETGAGKSIVIDAVSALLGGKVGLEFLRAGAEQAHVEGVFAFPRPGSEQCAQLTELLEHNGLNSDEDTLILTRELNSTGRTVARINGRAVPASLLQQMGHLLVDIHGQSEHLSLLRVSSHIDLLDRYAGLSDRRKQMAENVAAVRKLRRELEALMRDEREVARRIDLLRFQVQEIESARLEPGEEGQLEAERHIQANSETLMAAADQVFSHLYEGTDEQRAVVDLLGVVSSRLGDIARVDPSVEDKARMVEGHLAELEELSREIRSYRDGIEYDPKRLEEIEERLLLIKSLKRKYGGSIEEILKFGQQAAAEMDMLSSRGERIDDMRGKEQELLAELAEIAVGLSEARRQASERLSCGVERELADLNMARARFVVLQEQADDPEGVEVSGKRCAFDATGVDRIEFLLSPNPGEPPKPLAKIASGGETSRMMLALKTVLALADPVPTLIFDEIDQGIGGRSGQVVGKKLWSLRDGHQVICVTHLPQIACYGDAHLSVSKSVVGDRTASQVRALAGKERSEEIAAMLGGAADSIASLQNAEEILNEAKRWKKGD